MLGTLAGILMYSACQNADSSVFGETTSEGGVIPVLGVAAWKQEQQGFALPLLTVHAHTVMAHGGNFFLKEACLRAFLTPSSPSDCTYFSRFDHVPDGTGSKEPTCQCRRRKRREFDPWVRKIPWKGHSNPLHDSCLEQLSTYAHVCK